MSLFASGFKKVREEQERRDKVREALKGQLFTFFLTASQPEGVIVFTHAEPVVFSAHVIKEGTRYVTRVCTAKESDCPHCAEGDNPSTKGAYIIIDRTPFTYKDKSGKEVTNKGQLKLYMPGIRALGVLDKRNERKGLLGKEWYIDRSGSGQSTEYSFDTGEDFTITAKMIGELLPDQLKQFTPKSDDPKEIERSMLALLENQLKRLLPDYKEEEEQNADVVEAPKEETKRRFPRFGKKKEE